MAYIELPDSIIPVGNPVKHDIFSRLKDNQIDFNTRIGNLEGTSSKVIVFDEIIKKPTEHKIGDIKLSFLTELQYQKQFDDTWILSDGRNVVGSDYHNLTDNVNVPDMRGRYPRVKDNGAAVNPDGDLSLGATQDDINKEHNHTTVNHSHAITDPQHNHGLSNDSHGHAITDAGHEHNLTDINHTHGVTDPHANHNHDYNDPSHKHPLLQNGLGVNTPCLNPAANWSNNWVLGESTMIANNFTGITHNPDTGNITQTNLVNSWSGTPKTENDTTGISVNSNTTGGTIDNNTTGISVNSSNVTVNNDGGNETRPKTITVNSFIKINDSSFIMTKLFKSPFKFNLIGAVINNLIAGSAGTLQIDIKKGSSLTAMSTVFSTKPSLDHSAGNYANSTNAVFSQVIIDAGDWIQLNIDNFQTDQNKLHVYLTGEV